MFFLSSLSILLSNIKILLAIFSEFIHKKIEIDKYKNNQLSKEKIDSLNSILIWKWNILKENWQKQKDERVMNYELEPQLESKDPDGEYEADRDRDDRNRYEAERQYFEK